MTVQDTDSLANFGNLVVWTRAAALLTGALRRRGRAVFGLSLVFVAVGVTAAALLPRSYSTQARLLVKKNYVMPALANPKRAVPGGSEAAAQAAYESVLSRESLESMIRTNGLLARWDAERPFLLRAKDRVLELVRGPVSDEDKFDALVEVLGKRISVDVTNDVVTVKAVWVNRKTALDLANSAVDIFLESRRRFDVQTVADTLAILQKSAQVVRGQVEARLTEVVGHQRVATDVKLARAARRPAVLRTGGAPRPAADGLDDLRIQARQARGLREAIEARHQEQVADLETRLGERRSVLTARHPDIAALEHALAAVRPIPAELAAARAAEARLLADYAARGGQLATLELDPAAREEGEATIHADLRAAEDVSARVQDEEEDDATAYARSLLKASLETYQDLTARIRDAQIELETAEVAFRYRYTTVRPARLPRKPDAPNVILLVAGALVAGLGAGVVRAVFQELKAQALLSPEALAAYLTAPPASASAS